MQTQPSPSSKWLAKLKHPTHHSKVQIGVFVFVFGLFGYLIYHTLASSNFVTSLEAEQMSLPPGGSIITDNSASAGKAIKLLSNGSANGSVNLPTGVTSLTVMARADQCNGAPAMTVALDGSTKLSDILVSATGWTAYSYATPSAIVSGTHTLAISLTNAYANVGHGKRSSGSCARALYVDVTNFYGMTTAPPPLPTVALSASSTIVNAGQSSTLTWTSTNATSCTASGAWSGPEPLSSTTTTGALNKSSTYSLTCTGEGGSATASVKVGVSTASPSGLHVIGNHFADSSGNAIQLHGVHVVAFDWACSHPPGGDGWSLDQTAVNVILSWHINVVRLGLDEDCWLGLNGLPLGETAATYQQHVHGFIDLLKQNCIYSEVSLMYAAPGTKPAVAQPQMPDQDHTPAFWTSVATALKDETSTFFGIFGEPHPPFFGENAWDCLIKGGSYCPSVVYNLDGSNTPYVAAGMQELINDIRATGASQPISVGGVNWDTDLSAWLANKPLDPLNQVVAEHHMYVGDEACFEPGDVAVANNSICWDRVFSPITLQVPLYNGEAGEYAHSDACGWTYLPTWLSWAQAHGVSYVLWKWSTAPSTDPCKNMSLLTNLSGTPSPVYGQGYKNWLSQHPY